MKRRFFTSMSMFVDYESMDPLGFTDITSNAVFLTDIDPLQSLDELREGRLDLKFLPGILHECTHHSTFYMSVGCAMSALWASSISTQFLNLGSKFPTMAARDLAIIRTAYTLFQPMLEGLALFAEHDLLVGDSPLVSRVSEHAAPLFVKGRLGEILGIQDEKIIEAITSARNSDVMMKAYSQLLRQARCDQSWIEQKAKLLSQSVKEPPRYLMGYLAVKGMYYELMNRAPELADPELFLYVMLEFIFNDHDLTRLLLRWYNTPEEELDNYLIIGQDLNEFLEYFQNRLDYLYANTIKVIEVATKPYLQSNDVRWHKFPPDIEMLLGLRTFHPSINIAWPRLFNRHRLHFRFSFKEVLISVSDNGDVSIQDINGENEIYRTQAVKNSQRGTFIGSIEAIRLSDLATTVVCVLAGDGLVAVFDCSSGKWNVPNICEALDDLVSGVAIEGAMNAFSQKQKEIASYDELQAMMDDYAGQADEAVNLLYPQLACNGWVLEPRMRFMEALENQGFASLFDSPSILNRAAELSLLAGVGATTDSIANYLGMTLDNLLHEVSEINRVIREKTGFEPFQISNNKVAMRSKI